MERQMMQRGLRLAEAPREAMEKLWEESKVSEAGRNL
jgi:hypothetical protein